MRARIFPGVNGSFTGTARVAGISDMGMKDKHIYKIRFINLNQVYELYATHVESADMYGFVSVSGLIFDANDGGLVIDTAEEKLREEFNGVKRLLLPQQQIIRIEEVHQKQPCKISLLHGSERSQHGVDLKGGQQ